MDEVIDTEGHTAIHSWAAAMGDLELIELPCRADANIYGWGNLKPRCQKAPKSLNAAGYQQLQFF